MDLTLYQGKERNNNEEEFHLDDESRYSMSGKVLRYILTQIRENGKIPFADIKCESEKLQRINKHKRL